MRLFARTIIRGGYAVVGWLTAYLPLAGLLGILTAPISEYGGHWTSCLWSLAIGKLWFWSITIPGMAVGFAWAALKAGYRILSHITGGEYVLAKLSGLMALEWLTQSANFALYSLPAILLILIGITYWRARSKPVAWVLGGSILVEICYVGLVP